MGSHTRDNKVPPEPVFFNFLLESRSILFSNPGITIKQTWESQNDIGDLFAERICYGLWRIQVGSTIEIDIYTFNIPYIPNIRRTIFNYSESFERVIDRIFYTEINWG